MLWMIQNVEMTLNVYNPSCFAPSTSENVNYSAEDSTHENVHLQNASNG